MYEYENLIKKFEFIKKVDNIDYIIAKENIYSACKGACASLDVEDFGGCMLNCERALELTLQFIYKTYIRNKDIGLNDLIEDNELKNLLENHSSNKGLMKEVQQAGNKVKHDPNVPQPSEDKALSAFYGIIGPLQELCDFINNSKKAIVSISGKVKIEKKHDNSKDVDFLVANVSDFSDEKKLEKVKYEYRWRFLKSDTDSEFTLGPFKGNRLTIKEENYGRRVVVEITAQNRKGIISNQNAPYEIEYPQIRGNIFLEIINEDDKDYLSIIIGDDANFSLNDKDKRNIFVWKLIDENEKEELINYKGSKLLVKNYYSGKQIICSISRKNMSGNIVSPPFSVEVVKPRKIVEGELNIVEIFRSREYIELDAFFNTDNKDDEYIYTWFEKGKEIKDKSGKRGEYIEKKIGDSKIKLFFEQYGGKSIICLVTHNGWSGYIDSLPYLIECISETSKPGNENIRLNVINKEKHRPENNYKDQRGYENKRIRDNTNIEIDLNLEPYGIKDVKMPELPFFDKKNKDIKYFVCPNDEEFVLNSLEIVSKGQYLCRLLEHYDYKYIYDLILDYNNITWIDQSTQKTISTRTVSDHEKINIIHEIIECIKEIRNIISKAWPALIIHINDKKVCRDIINEIKKLNDVLIIVDIDSDIKEVPIIYNLFEEDDIYKAKDPEQLINKLKKEGKILSANDHFAKEHLADEIANLLFRKILINGDIRLSLIDIGKIYPISEAILKKYKDDYTSLIHILKEKLYDNDGYFIKEILDLAEVEKTVAIGYSKNLNPLCVERIFRSNIDRYHKRDNKKMDILTKDDFIAMYKDNVKHQADIIEDAILFIVDNCENAIGTGFVVYVKDTYVLALTCYHVWQDSTNNKDFTFAYSNKGIKYYCELLKEDRDVDMALIKIIPISNRNLNIKYIKLAEKDKCQRGMSVKLYGFPSITEEKISTNKQQEVWCTEYEIKRDKTKDTSGFGNIYYTIDFFEKGFSGSPIVNKDNEVVAIAYKSSSVKEDNLAEKKIGYIEPITYFWNKILRNKPTKKEV